MSNLHFDIDKFQSESMQNHMGDYWMRVDDQIHLLNRFVFLEWASARAIAGWVPAASEFEWKCGMAQVMWQDMIIAQKLHARKEELSGNNKILIPSDKINIFIQDASGADSYFAFLAAWFLEIKKGMVEGYERYMEALDPIFDAPTLEMLEDILPKKRKQIAWAQGIIHDAVKDPKVLVGVQGFRSYVRKYLLHLGGIDERLDFTFEKPECPVEQPYGPAPHERSKPDWLELTDFENPPKEVDHSLKLFMWHYMTEIQVVDLMCYAFYGLSDMPFEFFIDFSRHIWDETRHHQMGVRRLEQWGYDIRKLPLPYGKDSIKDLEQYYTQLTMFSETCSFKRKRKSMKAFYEKGDIISGMTAEIDIVDERTHVSFGKKWVSELHKRLGDKRNLEQIVRDTMKSMQHSRLDEEQVSAEERESLTHFAFCGKLEFKNLNFDQL